MKPEEKENITKDMASFIGDLTGSCPADMFNYEVSEGCESQCCKHGRDTVSNFYKCWIEYFKEKKGE